MSRRSELLPKTHAKSIFCLADKDLEALQAVEQRNPRSRNGPPMRLYNRAQVESLAHRKWGGPEGLAAEQRKRESRRAARSAAAAASPTSRDGTTTATDVAGVPNVPPGQEPAGGSGPTRAAATVTAASSSLACNFAWLGLPPLIAERVRPIRVLTAVRGHENPALDVARAAAERLGLPLLVAAFVLPACQPYANHRRVKFLLEEDMPVDPDAAQIAELARHLDSERAGAGDAAVTVREQPGTGTGSRPEPGPGLWAVDSACVVPMRLVGRPYEKAYAFRSATEVAAAPTLAPPPSAPPARGASHNGDVCGSNMAAVASSLPATAAADAAATLGWTSLDLQRPGLDLSELAASLPGVDRSVPDVGHMPGGSSAGYARWDGWRRGGGLARYAAERNDAMRRCGSSRMSAYLHWGMVSPFRIAREAAASGGGGSAKFLDELLVWRELSYSFCFHRYAQLESLAVLPRWAQDTLAAHSADPRVIKSLQQLESGTTGDAFWDAAQRQLVTHGELHNNVRMTWGKAFLGWCASPREALAAAVRLNHRYALDGCDPASYGGILWCFGLFDGPKEASSTPVSGMLRRRPTSVHARRLDAAAYARLPP
ncbi:PHR2 protein [Gonium pectorale]|uniref:PHR2 protein n=1 Tax=Gonium pectorale TaxID=33097 RepID=A0A150GMS6_GONPE|nr:PHR2 protein [Gonium pectorale]|eukprot:KXZ50650.1 PHR2 protein [Gonium pectorale]